MAALLFGACRSNPEAEADNQLSGSLPPPLKVGLIGDIQYADCEDGTDFSGTETRRFRNTLAITRSAVKIWNSQNCQVVIQLGDVIDGRNTRTNGSHTALESVLSILRESSAPRRFDLIGNHELYNFKRASLPPTLQCFGEDGHIYRSEKLNEHWQAIILDPYENSLVGYDSSDNGYQEAERIIRGTNPQALKEDGDWFEGVPEDFHRFNPFNGGISAAQVEWLETSLACVAAEGRKALVFSHIPLWCPASKNTTIMWNADDVLSVLHAFRDAVVAVFAGHDHHGGYAVDSAGLHHITMCAPLLADVGSDCCAVIECHADGTARFVAHGRAVVESDSRGEGRAFSELALAKGATNEPGLRSRASVLAAAAAEARLASQQPEADSPALRDLLAMGYSQEQAAGALREARGDVQRAVERLLDVKC